MRRKDREITDFNEIEAIIKSVKVLHLGLFDGQYPYVVPMSYGYEKKQDKLYFLMHSASEGHKLDLIKNNNNACIELENNVEPVSGGELACKYSTYYSSVIARGKLEILSQVEEKAAGLQLIMKHQTGRDFTITPEMAENVAVLRFTVDSITAKAKKKQ